MTNVPTIQPPQLLNFQPIKSTGEQQSKWRIAYEKGEMQMVYDTSAGHGIFYPRELVRSALRRKKEELNVESHT
jgi:hypothetical protein